MIILSTLHHLPFCCVSASHRPPRILVNFLQAPLKESTPVFCLNASIVRNRSLSAMMLCLSGRELAMVFLKCYNAISMRFAGTVA